MDNKQQSPGVRIRISARRGNGDAERCFGVFKAWAALHPGADVLRTGPLGYEDLEPLVLIEKPEAPEIWYARVTEDKAAALAAGWLGGDDPMPELALGVSGDDAFRDIPTLNSLPLFRLQERVALRNCGLYDPESVVSYLTVSGGLEGLKSALRMTATVVLEHIGRIGAREKDWKAFGDRSDGTKVLVITAFNNDAEARMARLLLESDPFGVLEGLLIAAYAVGASRAILAIPAGTGEIRSVLDSALTQLREQLEANGAVLEAGFNCGIELREIPISLVINDKTALLRCLEGLQAIPALPGNDGDMFGGAPALVTAIEALAALPPILQRDNGGAAAAGTKILTLSGELPHPYTVEVPLGTTIGALVFDIGGASDVKAVQLGGPTGVWLGPDAFNKPVSRGAATEAGADFGISLLNIASSSADAVELAEKQLRFLRGESCGKCVFCREGTLHLHELLVGFLRGTCLGHDLKLMEEVGLKMRSNCLCALGTAAADSVLSIIKLFRPEFEAQLGRNAGDLPRTQAL
jgi:NADH:ubiquinone oxidoreductase subunit F (NADH-binding)